MYVDIKQLAERFGTPLYCYDLDAALAQLSVLRSALGGQAEVYYAIKANPNRRVVELLRGSVVGADVSSGGELELALAAGFDPAAISFAGPGKIDRELRLALERGVGLISVESEGELERLAAIAGDLGCRAAITLRVNPREAPRALMIKMGGRPSAFGVDEEQAPALLARALDDERLDLAGLHVYAGTQCLDPQGIVEGIEGTLRLSARLADEVGFTPRVVNLGGGFGVAHLAGERALDVAVVGERVAAALDVGRERYRRLRAARWIVELGRFLIGPFGRYLARVVEVKLSRGKRFVVLDGGLNHLLAASGNLGQVIKRNYAIAHIPGGEDPPGPPEAHEIVGPLCTPLDTLGRSVELPRVERGDLIVFGNCGAYGYSASPLLFLGHETPLEIVRYQGREEVARGRFVTTSFGNL